VTLSRCLFEQNDEEGLRTTDSSVTVSDSRFAGNRRFGMFSSWGPVSVARCEFRGHDAAEGRGLFARQIDGDVMGSTFIDNSVGMDAHESEVAITGSTFAGNIGRGLVLTNGVLRVEDSAFSRNGGGILIQNESVATIRGSTFVENEATDSGGGVAFGLGFGLEIEDSIFRRNRADDDGGGVWLSHLYGDMTVTNNIFDRNRAGRDGGGLHVQHVREGGVTVLNDTFSRNDAARSGGALSVAEPDPTLPIGAPVSVINAILWRNRGGEIAPGGPVSVAHSDVRGGFPGPGNIDEDPLFVRPGAGDLRLRPGSPCRDAGIDTGSLPPADLDGNPRIQGPRPDMGAYELPACD